MTRQGILVEPYERLSYEQLEQVHQASLDILKDPGMLCFNKEAAQYFGDNGAEVAVVDQGEIPCWKIQIPEKMIAMALQSAPQVVKLGARDENNSLLLDGAESRVFLVSGSETNIWLDVDFSPYVKKSNPDIEVSVPEFHRRRGTVADLCQAAHLCENLDTLDAFIRPVNIQDKDITGDNKDVNKYFASLDNTTKHVMAGLTKLEQLDNVVHMAEIIAGGKKQLRENPIISFITCLVKSPLQFIDDTTQTLIEISKKKLPLVVSCSPQAGTTAPLTELGITVQINAEILAGITLSQLVNKGTPVLYGSVPVRTRLDTLNDSYGAPETSQYNIDSVQMARFYKLPCYSTSGVCDNKTPGLQSTVERMLSNILVTLSGPQYLHCAYGLLDSNGTFCPLQAVLDDVHFQMLKFFLQTPKYTKDDFEKNISQIREVAASPKKLYIRYIRSLIRTGQVTMPYPFEGDGTTDTVLALADEKMRQLLSLPAKHIDGVITNKVFQEIPGLLPRLNIHGEGGK